MTPQEGDVSVGRHNCQKTLGSFWLSFCEYA